VCVGTVIAVVCVVVLEVGEKHKKVPQPPYLTPPLLLLKLQLPLLTMTLE
jgi:hypothetical protein